MGGGANLYSLEAISDALIGAGSIAASSRDEQQIIRGYLVPLQNVLHAGCVASHRADILFGEADRLTIARDHQHVVVA